MKTKMLSLVAVGTLCLILCGCFNMSAARIPGSNDDHLVVSNYGWFLFNFIPIGCGNASPDPNTKIMIFRNDVTMNKIQTRFMDEAQRLGKRAEELSWHNYSSVTLTLPWAGFSIPIPYLLTYREVQLTGVLK